MQELPYMNEAVQVVGRTAYWPRRSAVMIETWFVCVCVGVVGIGSRGSSLVLFFFLLFQSE